MHSINMISRLWNDTGIMSGAIFTFFAHLCIRVRHQAPHARGRRLSCALLRLCTS